VSKSAQPGAITGKISATPNPISFGQGCVVISWETNDPAGAEVRVSTSPGHEQLVIQGQSGQTEIPWIVDSTIYDFRLYAASQPQTPIDSVQVRRALDSAPLVLRDLADEALRGNIDMAELSRFIAAVIPSYLHTANFRQIFPVVLRELAIKIMRGNVDMAELSRFIATVIPTYLHDTITGKIIATPDRISFGPDRVMISWGTNDPAGGDVRVSTSGSDEKLLSREPSGEMEISWIADSTVYDFRLYAASKPETAIDSVKVRRDIDSASMVLRELADEVMRGNIDLAELSQFIATVIPHCLHSADFREFFPVILRELATEVMRGNIDLAELSQFVATVMPRCLHSGKFHQLFPVWERHGFHVTPVHFYQPIPDTQSLPKTLWSRPSTLVGIDMNDSVQLDLLRKRFPKFREEYEQFPTKPTGEPSRFYLNNGPFDGADALVAYCMVRHFQPDLIIEVGSGFSSLVSGEAAAKNNSSALICIEPFPQEFLKQGFPGLHSLIEKRVEDVDLEFFSELGSGDILFIDSSHTVRIGGDVNYLFLEVLPRLKPGVIVHVHDIFLPFEYRRDWVMDEFRFWTEQYLLQAFLSFNSEFEVLVANSYLSHYYKDDLKAAFPSLASWGGGSFWMRRKPPTVRLSGQNHRKRKKKFPGRRMTERSSRTPR
jgi:hypothetical protein